MRETDAGQYGALDRGAIIDAHLTLMMAEGPAVVADHAFTTGKIAQTGFERPLRPSREKVGIVNGFGCFPEQVSAAKNTGSFIPDDFEHEIGTNFVARPHRIGRLFVGLRHGGHIPGYSEYEAALPEIRCFCVFLVSEVRSR
jgi:hypothetical protein